MAALERDFVPATQYFFPICIRPFDVVFGAVMKSASPAPRLTPIDKKAKRPQPILPILEHLTFGRQIIDKWQVVAVWAA
jgi:hypothetical protein